MSLWSNPIGGIRGGGSTSRLILGAANETVTYNGGASGTVTLDANGSGSISIPNGTYQFTGGVSGYSTGILTVDANTSVIYVRPVGTIYWYGVWAEEIYHTYGSDPGPVDNTTYFRWNFPHNGNWAALYTNNEGTGYTTCTIRNKGGTDGYCRLGYGNAGADPSGQTIVTVSNKSTWGDTTLTFSPTSGRTIKLYGYKYNNRSLYVDICEWYLGDR